MSTNISGNSSFPWIKTSTDNSKNDLRMNLLKEFYATNLPEDERGTFDESFPEGARLKVENEHLYTKGSDCSQPYEFYNSLIDNKEYLTNTLDLSSEEYDALTCIALGLASQETGMGMEDGYLEEQSGLYSLARKIGITFGSKHSASSGLTQIKIFDQMENMERFYSSIMKQKGVDAKSKTSDNLNNPEYSAIATMVVLKTIMLNYENYEKTMNENHQNLAEQFENQGINSQEAEEKGFDYLSQIYQKYQNSSDEEKIEIRLAFKQLLKSTDGSTKENPSPDGEKYTEEIQFERLKEALGSDVALEDDALSYLKLALSSEICQMDKVEYCAYAWNCGTGETGMQPDRIMAEKIGIILSNPEDFDYDQYAANVIALSEKYAQQVTGYDNTDDAYIALKEALEEDDKEEKGTY